MKKKTLSGIGFTFLGEDFREKSYLRDEDIQSSSSRLVRSWVEQANREVKEKQEKENKFLYDKALRNMTKALKYQKKQKIQKKNINGHGRELYNIYSNHITKIIHGIKKVKVEAEWRETQEYRDLDENKILEFIKPYKEIAISTIAEHFLSKGMIANPEKYLQTANKTIKAKLNNLIIHKAIQGSIQFLPNRTGLNYINEKKIKEIKQKIVYKVLLEFSENFPRITLQELVDKVNDKVRKKFPYSEEISNTKAKELAISFINTGLVSANYDNPSNNAIDFLVMGGEIDELLKKYDDWEKSEEGKKED